MTNRCTRRQLLASVGAILGGTLALQGSARGQSVPELATPDAVSVSFDRERLKRYQPALITSEQNRPRIKGHFGYIAEHEDREMTAYAYWLQLTHQDGVPGFSQDSHLGDHEPIYVFVGSEGVQSVVYSAYHHYAAEVKDPELAAIAADEPTHVPLEIIDPWHMFRYVPERRGSLLDLRDWLAVRETWAKNGFYESTSNEAVDNPFVMADGRETWWDEATWDYRAAAIWRLIGWAGAGDADPTRASTFDFL